MKPFHWTLLAVCLAGCHSSESADSPRLGRDSREVVPELPQPKVLGATPDAPQAATSAKVEPAVQVRPHSSLPPALEFLASAIATALVRAASEPANSTTAQNSAAVATAHTEDDTPHGTSDAAVPNGPVASAPRDPASLLEKAPLIEAAIERAYADKDWRALAEYSAQRAALPSLENARVLCRDGRFDAALAELELALLSAPDRPELLEETGNVRLALAEKGRTDLYPAAMDAFERAGERPGALLGSSRAARALGKPELALQRAQRAMELLSSRPAERLKIAPAPEVVLADAGMEVQRKLRATSSASAPTLLQELIDALNWRIARENKDVAAHQRLADLYLEVGRVAEAEVAARNGLESNPADVELAALLARAARSLGGSEELLAEFKIFRGKHPEQPLGYWYPALEFFSNSVARLTLPMFEGSGKAQLEQAERYFRITRQQDERYADSCRQYEVLSRALQGWELLRSSRFEDARKMFESMNDVLAGSVALEPASVDERWAGQIESGASGLERIAAHHREAGEFVLAAQVQAELADLAPNDPRRAREAADSAKAAAESLRDDVELLESAGRGEIGDPARLNRLRKLSRVPPREVATPKELERFKVAADKRRADSDELYDTSWNRYQEAIRLAPEDVRLICDAVHMAIYHVPGDLARAEAHLVGAIRLAREQIQDPQLEPAARDQLKYVLAGALSDQGTLEYPIRNNPDAAVSLFHEALDIEPLRLPFVREHLLPRAVEASSKLHAGESQTTTAESPQKNQ